jgi:predicted transcriptional regulator
VTLTLAIAPELADALREMARRAGLDPDHYIVRALQDHVERHRDEPPRLSQDEALLLQEINQGLPAETWQRYHDLVAKRRAETLTPEEHEELMALTNEVEIWNARRVELVSDLARLRNVSLSRMMDELGLTTPPYA